MINKILTTIFGSRNDREMKRLAPKVTQVNAFEPALQFLARGNFQRAAFVLAGQKSPLKRKIANPALSAFASPAKAARRLTLLAPAPTMTT